MSWFYVDDQLHVGLKRLKVSTAALGLWVCAGSWSRDQKTGGYIPREALRALAPDLSDEHRYALAAELVDAKIDGIHEHGFWLPLANGWQFHDWEKQYGEDEIQGESRAKLSEIRAQAGRRGAEVRWAKRDGKPMAQAEVAMFANGNAGSDSRSDPVSSSASVASAHSGASAPDQTQARESNDGATAQAKAKSPFASELERQVFEHWASVLWPLVHKQGQPRATSKRLTHIRARLRDGFTPAQLCAVVDTVARDRFMLGENDRGRTYVEPENFLRSREKVETWMAKPQTGPARGKCAPVQASTGFDPFKHAVGADGKPAGGAHAPG